MLGVVNAWVHNIMFGAKLTPTMPPGILSVVFSFNLHIITHAQLHIVHDKSVATSGCTRNEQSLVAANGVLTSGATVTGKSLVAANSVPASGNMNGQSMGLSRSSPC